MAKVHGTKDINCDRVTTGVPRLDDILRGGFIRGGFYVLIGPPGGGKTLLANQILFHHIKASGGVGSYLTVMAESTAKMIRHLEVMKFFDATCLPDRLEYVSGYQMLRQEGLTGVIRLLQGIAQKRRPSFLVIDSLESVKDLANSDMELKEFLQEATTLLGLSNCTLLATSIGCMTANGPELVLSDGVLELSDSMVGPRAVRELTIHKFRGTDYLRGRHEVEISDEGVQIHPRTEIQFDKPPEEATEKRLRMPFGIESLDRMMEGGPLSGSATALVGAPGTGKTLLGLSFLTEGARRGEKGIYFGFYEPPPRLVEKAQNLGLDFQSCVKKGQIDVIWQPPLEHYMDSLAEQLLEKIRREASHARTRLFIDGIEGFRSAAVYAERIPRFLSAFTNQLRMLDVTTLVSEELHLFKPNVEMPNPELANVVESVVLLRYVELRSQLYRLLSIMKMRESKFDASIREFKLTDEGIVVSDSFKSAEAVLTGHGRVSKGTAE